jgi:NO-binding membrane sensor protein with MHYT domain
MITMGVDKRDHGVRNVEELTALTAMAPLAIIARIETPFDVADKQRRRRLWWSAAGACLGLGVLAVHFFYMDLYILWARLARMIEHYW